MQTRDNDMCMINYLPPRLAQAMVSGSFDKIDSIRFTVTAGGAPYNVTKNVTVEYGGDGVETYVTFISDKWTNNTGQGATVAEIKLGYNLGIDGTVYFCWGCAAISPAHMVFDGNDFYVHWKVQVEPVDEETEVDDDFQKQIAKMLTTSVIETGNKVGFVDIVNNETVKQALLIDGGDGVEDYYTNRAAVMIDEVKYAIAQLRSDNHVHTEHTLSYDELDEDKCIAIDGKVEFSGDMCEIQPY